MKKENPDINHIIRLFSPNHVHPQTNAVFKMLLFLFLMPPGLYEFEFLSEIVPNKFLCGLPLDFLALRHNNPSYMNVYGCCCSLLGVFPMVYLLYSALWTGVVDQFRYVRMAVAVAVILSNGAGTKNLMEVWTVKTKT